MQITLLDIDLNKYSNSWVTILSISTGWRSRALFQIEWTSDNEILSFDVLFIRFNF